MSAAKTMPDSRATRTLSLQAAGNTQRGETRRINQDSLYHRAGRLSSGEVAGLYILCDGMGGHEAGEVASQLAVQLISEALEVVLGGAATQDADLTQPSLATTEARVQAAIAKANRRLHDHWGRGEGPT